MGVRAYSPYSPRTARPVETRLSGVALLPGEPAGTVATRTAGSVYVEACISGRPGEPVGSGALFGGLPDLGAARSCLAEGEESTPERRVMRGEVRALSETALRSALDVLMRHLTAEAAVAEVVLETRAERRASVAVAPAGATGALARDLHDAGLQVRLRDCWSPLPPGAAVAVGARGLEDEIERFLLETPAWSVVR